MIGMFWAEKYAMVTGLTLVVRKLFHYRGRKDKWLTSATAMTALISMNLGAGLLYPYPKERYLFGVAEGVFVGSMLLLCWMSVEKLNEMRKKTVQKSGIESR